MGGYVESRTEEYSPEELAVLANESSDLASRVFAAKHPSTPSQSLRLLAHSENIGIRAAVGRNNNAPAAVLNKLSKDPEGVVRSGVAGNRSTASRLLARLVMDDEHMVVNNASGNPGLSAASIWWQVENTDNMQQMSHLAENLSLPADCVPVLLKRGDTNVLCFLVNNPVFPPELLDGINLNDYEDYLTDTIAKNPHISSNVVDKIVARNRHYSLKILVSNPACSLDVVYHVLDDCGMTDDEVGRFRACAERIAKDDPKFVGYPIEWVEAALSKEVKEAV